MNFTGIDPAELSQATGVRFVEPTRDFGGITAMRFGPVVAEPETAKEVSSLLAWANERDLKVVIVGGGTKIERGNEPTACDIILSTLRITGLVEHAAGDMTATVRAGTPLAELQSSLALAGQFLAVDPPFPGTVGGLIASGDSGPRRLYYGGVRDMLLGVTFVRADGAIARGGGKVVKNVAGYDLPKLLTGSLGTLGVIVEATFRLYPIPPSSATVVSTGLTPGETAEAAARLQAGGLTPTILDYFRTGGQNGLFAARFESSTRSVQGQAERALSLVAKSRTLADQDESDLWLQFDKLAQTEQGDTLARLITTQSDLPRLLVSADNHAQQLGLGISIRAHLAHGHALVRLHQPAGEAALAFLNRIRAEAEHNQGNLVLMVTPGALQGRIDPWGDPGEGLTLMRKVKEQFDPKSTLNPGRFVGGI